MKKLLKKSTAVLLAAIMIFSCACAAGITSFAAESQATPSLPEFAQKDSVYACGDPSSASAQAWQKWEQQGGENAQEGIYYIFLPKTASDSEVLLYNTFSSDISVNGTVIAPESHGTVGYTQGETAEVTVDGSVYKMQVYKSDADASVYINDTTGVYKGADGATVETDFYSFLTANKENSVSGSYCTIIDDSGTNDTALKKIKGRGNTTWHSSYKKPFNLTFSEKTSIAGLSSKKFSLLSNSKDGSLLRNKVMYDLAHEVGNEYAPDSRFMDLYINGIYRGSYQITQKVDLGKNSLVSLKDESDVLTEGFSFVVEVDIWNYGGDVYYISDRDIPVVCKSPDLDGYDGVDETLNAQYAYISGKYQQLEDAIYSGTMEELEKICDVNSLATGYLLQEFSKNCDGGMTSCYFTYNASEGKFYAAPAWDFDSGLGNVSCRRQNATNTAATSGWITRTAQYDGTDRTNIMGQPFALEGVTSQGKTFEETVEQVWSEKFVPAIAVLKGEQSASGGRLKSVAEYAEATKSLAYINFLQWNTEWYPYYEALNGNYAYTRDGQVSYMLDWLKARENWITSFYSGSTLPEGSSYYLTGVGFGGWGAKDYRLEKVNGFYSIYLTFEKGTEYVFKIFDGGRNYFTAELDDPVTARYFTYSEDENHNACITPDEDISGTIKFDGVGFTFVPDEQETTEPPTTEPETTEPVTTVPPVPGNTVVYFDNSVYNWSKVYTYVYGGDGEGGVINNATWPGVEMTSAGNNLYYYNIDMGLESYMVIFTNGSGTQFPGENEPGLVINAGEKKIFNGSALVDYKVEPATTEPTTTEPETTEPETTEPATTEPETTEPVTTVPPAPGKTVVYFDNSGYNWPKVYAYVYSGDGEGGVICNATWPGVEMTSAGNNLYYYNIDMGLESYMVIFTNGSGTQFPGENEPGLVINAGEKKIINGSALVDYKVEPATTEPTTTEPETTEPPTTEPETTEPPVTKIKGDVNSDGEYSIKDAAAIQLYIAQLYNGVFDETVADVNGDGEIGIKDAAYIQLDLAKLLAVDDGDSDWRTSTISYEIFVRSFCDSDGDGIGDFRGIASKASYLKELNVGCVWLMPIHPSPTYHGYDVTDYYSTNEDYGTIDDFKYMLDVLHQYDIKVLIDFVASLTSSQHPWFVDALSNPDSPYVDYYEFADEPGTSSDWRYNEEYDKYYRGFYTETMPNLNYRNKAVWEEMKNVAGYWLDIGVDGFRLDSAMHIDDDFSIIHAWWQDFESYVKSKNPEAFMVGENWTEEVETVASFFADMDSSFDFPLQVQIYLLASGQQRDIVDFVNFELSRQKYYANTTPDVPKTSVMTTFLNNHDQTRTATGLGLEKSKLAAAIQFTLPGMPFIYYGEELGQLSDGYDPNRREAMDWYASAKGEGMCVMDEAFFGTTVKYTKAYDGISLEEEIDDENSIYSYYKKLTQLRTDYPIFFDGDYYSIDSKSLNCYTVTDENLSYGMFVAHNVTRSDIELTALYDFTDLLSGNSYKAGDTVTVAPYTTIVAEYDGKDKKFSLFDQIQSVDIPVTFNVTIPEKLPDGANISIGTNMNYWNPADSEWVMTKIDDLHYQLDTTISSTYVGEPIEYKYTVQLDGQASPWACVELGENRQDIGNRVYTLSAENNVINDTVISFNNL